MHVLELEGGWGILWGAELETAAGVPLDPASEVSTTSAVTFLGVSLRPLTCTPYELVDCKAPDTLLQTCRASSVTAGPCDSYPNGEGLKPSASWLRCHAAGQSVLLICFK